MTHEPMDTEDAHDTRTCATCAVHEIEHNQVEQWRQDFADNPNKQPDGCATVLYLVAALAFLGLMWAAIVWFALAVT